MPLEEHFTFPVNAILVPAFQYGKGVAFELTEKDVNFELVGMKKGANYVKIEIGSQMTASRYIFVKMCNIMPMDKYYIHSYRKI